jgi:hypothetical protein
MEVLLAESASGLTRSSPFPSTQHHVQSMPRLPARQLQNDEGLSAVAYHCDENNDEERSDRPLEIGSAVRICIETGRPAKIRDIYILKINTFRFLKQNADGTTVVQEAIDNGVASDNGSTNIGNACDRGVEICAFTTKLKNDFFDSDGTVKGIGSVALQIGKGDDRRELEVALRGRRKMQDFAGMVGVDMSFAVEDGENKRPMQYAKFTVKEHWHDSPTHMQGLYIAAFLILLLLICCFCAGLILWRDCCADVRRKITGEAPPVVETLPPIYMNNPKGDRDPSETHSVDDDEEWDTDGSGDEYDDEFASARKQESFKQLGYEEDESSGYEEDESSRGTSVSSARASRASSSQVSERQVVPYEESGQSGRKM